MKTEVKKRLSTCLILWTAFVLIKWVMLLSPSSILSKFGPFMVIFRDPSDNYNVSGWVAIIFETVLLGGFYLIRRKKLTPLYIVCAVYSLFYIPALIYWMIAMEFEPWRYMQFAPAVLCAVFMAVGFIEYKNQAKLRRPKNKPVKKTDDKKDTDSDKEEK